MKAATPNLVVLNKIEERLIKARLDATRAALSHAGEKGRVLERGVANILRAMLPAEYGLSTGFVAYIEDGVAKLTPQLDVIIYDAVRGGPIVRLETSDVFPLESVYGYVEVKASIVSASDEAAEFAEHSIESALERNRALRAEPLRRGGYYFPVGKVGSKYREQHLVGLRSYLFAFEATGSAADADYLAQRIADFSQRLGHHTHMHGVFIADVGFFYTQPIDRHNTKRDPDHTIIFAREHALLEFKIRMLDDLGRFPRVPENWTPALDRYHSERGSWSKRSPTSAPPVTPGPAPKRA